MIHFVTGTTETGLVYAAAGFSPAVLAESVLGFLAAYMCLSMVAFLILVAVQQWQRLTIPYNRIRRLGPPPLVHCGLAYAMSCMFLIIPIILVFFTQVILKKVKAKWSK